MADLPGHWADIRHCSEGTDGDNPARIAPQLVLVEVVNKAADFTTSETLIINKCDGQLFKQCDMQPIPADWYVNDSNHPEAALKPRAYLHTYIHVHELSQYSDQATLQTTKSIPGRHRVQTGSGDHPSRITGMFPER
jgi:hypothetical protein